VGDGDVSRALSNEVTSLMAVIKSSSGSGRGSEDIRGTDPTSLLDFL